MWSSVSLLGRFTERPELKITPKAGTSVTNFCLAVDDGWGDKKHASFVDCVAFGKTAENVCKYMDKGRLILVAGRLRTRSYEGNDGAKRKVTEVIVSESTFIPGGKKDDNRQEPPE